MKKGNKQMLFEMMHKVAGMPLNEMAKPIKEFRNTIGDKKMVYYLMPNTPKAEEKGYDTSIFKVDNYHGNVTLSYYWLNRESDENWYKPKYGTHVDEYKSQYISQSREPEKANMLIQKHNL